MATQLATTEEPTGSRVPAVVSREAENFALEQRKARMFSMSPLVPQHLRNGGPEQAMANCYIALTLADAMGEMPLIVMQNIHVINGKAGFASKYMIARANASGKFRDDLDWEFEGSGPTLSATCFATLAKTGRRVEMKVDMAMAKAEGWTKNAKYQSMPELMLRYRSASFLVNLYAPEVMLGYRSSEELEDMRASGAIGIEASEPLTVTAIEHQAAGAPGEGEGEEPEVLEAEIVQEGASDHQRGEGTTLESARAEIDAAELVPDVNSRVTALIPLLGDEDAEVLRQHAMDRIAALSAK